MTTPTIGGGRHHGDPSPDGGNITPETVVGWGSETTRDQGLGSDRCLSEPSGDLGPLLRTATVDAGGEWENSRGVSRQQVGSDS